MKYGDKIIKMEGVIVEVHDGCVDVYKRQDRERVDLYSFDWKRRLRFAEGTSL